MTSTFPSGRTYADEIQNFANWFSYYRKRKLMLAASMGLEQMTKRVRIKCGRCRTVNVAVFDAKGET